MIDAHRTEFPSPGSAALARNAEALRVALAVNPALQDARAAYVHTLLALGRPEDARRAFEPLQQRAAQEPALAMLELRVQVALAAVALPSEAVLCAAAALPCEAVLCAAAAEVPQDSDRHWHLALRRLADGRWQPALDALLELVRRDRAFEDDAARRAMVAAFGLCEDAVLVREYRRRLAAVLN